MKFNLYVIETKEGKLQEPKLVGKLSSNPSFVPRLGEFVIVDEQSLTVKFIRHVYKSSKVSEDTVFMESLDIFAEPMSVEDIKRLRRG